ncbi:hypothetical protein [Pseudonocardia spinosispora]|uniref:hypothetical protein n=1 Tax=Pseudonocardia spinosispora TaxID=103441 RepID=UPI0003FF09E3|nr:hypothetical protein [Pseudonocardia spinosispora]
MAGPKINAERWSVVVSLVVAAAMATIALITVQRAGCEDPGRYVPTASGYELVGGCVEPGDLTIGTDVEPAPAPTPPRPDDHLPFRP